MTRRKVKYIDADGRHAAVIYDDKPATGWRAMTPERLRQASIALGVDPEDSTDDEKAALQEYIDGGGNVWAL